MRQDQPQTRGITCHLEDRLTDHRISSGYLCCQPHSIDSRRLSPLPPLRIHQISPYQSITFSRTSPICNLNCHSHKPPLIVNQKTFHLLYPSHRKTHIVETLRLSDCHGLLLLHQRDSYEYREIHRPHSSQPGYSTTHSKLFAPQPRQPNPSQSQSRPTCQSPQQKLRWPHAQPHSR
jgi:hypothetical protein